MPTFSSNIAFCGVAVMAKASQPGLTKTRLCPPLTFEEAANFNTAFLKDIAENLIAASARTSLAGTMAFGPPRSEAFFRSICLEISRFTKFGAPISETVCMKR